MQFSYKGKIETAIGNKIQSDCVVNQKCTININELTWFSWDTMFYIPPGSTYIDKNQIIGKEYFKESRFGSSTTLVFFKGGEIIYAEENFAEIEGYRSGEVEFSDFDPLASYIKYPPNSIFEVERGRTKDGEYYSLQCNNCKE